VCRAGLCTNTQWVVHLSDPPLQSSPDYLINPPYLAEQAQLWRLVLIVSGWFTFRRGLRRMSQFAGRSDGGDGVSDTIHGAAEQAAPFDPTSIIQV